MRIMEGQGVDGHVGDESSSKRNAFVRVFENVSLFSSLLSFLFVGSCLVLSCLVLWCVCVCWCARVLACSTLPTVSLRSFPQESRSTTTLSGTAKDRRNRERVVLDLFSYFKCVRYKGYFR